MNAFIFSLAVEDFLYIIPVVANNATTILLINNLDNHLSKRDLLFITSFYFDVLQQYKVLFVLLLNSQTTFIDLDNLNFIVIESNFIENTVQDICFKDNKRIKPENYKLYSNINFFSNSIY